MFKPDTLKAGFQVSIFFLLSFVLLGEPLLLSLFLAGLGGLAGGFLFAGWKNTELPSLPSPAAESKREEKIIRSEESNQQKPQQSRRRTRRSWFFWKNTPSSKRRR